MVLEAGLGITALSLAAALGSPLAAAAAALQGADPQRLRVYAGTYTSGDSRGIYRLELDMESGALTLAGEPTPAADPSFLAIGLEGRFLYAVNEVAESPGGVSAFAIEAATGALTLLNQQPSGGAAPCHLAVHPSGSHLLVANYGGSVAVLPIEPDGRLGPASDQVRREGSSVHERQRGPHAHWIEADPSGRFAVVADLGTDEIASYRFDAVSGRLTPHDTLRLGPGAGPRHAAFHPDGRRAYVISELDSTVTVLSFDADAGRFESLQVVPTLPEGYRGGNSTAEIAVHPGGRFLYGSNRGHDSIAIFAIDAATGTLTPAGHVPTRGRTPRNFAIDPSGRFLLAANQGSDSVAVFRISERDGGLEPVGEPVHVPRPVCLLFAPPGRSAGSHHDAEDR